MTRGGFGARRDCSLHHGNRVLFVPLSARSCTDQVDALHAAQQSNVLVAHQISCSWKDLIWKGAVIGPGFGGKRDRQVWAGPDPPGQDGGRGRIYNDDAFRAWRPA